MGATPRAPPPPLSPPLALLPPPSPLSEVPTPVLDVTSPTPLEPSMLPRGRPRLTPLDTTGVRFCQDVLDLDATLLPTFCHWIGSRGISTCFKYKIWNSCIS